MKNFIVLYCSPKTVRAIKSRKLRWSDVARVEDGSSTFKKFTSKLRGKRSFGKPRLSWEENIRMDLKEVGVNMRNMTISAQYRDYKRALELPGSINHGVNSTQ